MSPIFQILIMFKVYLKIAWKNISRNRVYTIINVAGLALGIIVGPKNILILLERVENKKIYYFTNREHTKSRNIPLK